MPMVPIAFAALLAGFMPAEATGMPSGCGQMRRVTAQHSPTTTATTELVQAWLSAIETTDIGAKTASANPASSRVGSHPDR